MNNINIVLFNNYWLVSRLEEIPDVEWGSPDCVLEYPYEIVHGDLVKWPQHSNDNKVVVRSTEFSVIVEPSPEILQKYLKLIEETE